MEPEEPSEVEFIETPIQLLYILGTGRSGSTILDITLGNHPCMESVGELQNFIRSGWVDGRVLRSPFCACGRRVDVDEADACPFWSSVRREWVERSAPDSIENYVSLQDTFERYRSLTRLLRERRAPSARFRSYAGLTRTLFEAISAVSGKPIVVDSSKAPLRALALSMTPGIDLFVIHLVRDGRGVTSSRRKAFRKNPEAGVWWTNHPHPVWKSSVLWVGENLASGWVRKRLAPGKSVRVRYEDFVENPSVIMGRIGGLMGIDLTELAREAAAGGVLRIGHNVSGNRMRMSKEVRLRPDVGEWRHALSIKEQRLSWTIMRPLMLRYGYKR